MTRSGRNGSTRRSGVGQLSEEGFTLVELLVVLAIIGLLAALVGPQVLRYLGTSRVGTTQAQLRSLGSALELYHLDVGSYPTQDQGLAALWSPPASVVGWAGPYLKVQDGLKDGWGRDYHFEGGSGGVRVLSLGRDGEPGGEGQDADLVYHAR